MEYERALFRVYERLLEGVGESGTPNSINKICRLFEFTALTLAITLLISLGILHVSFVGNGGCLPQILEDYALIHQNSSNFNFSNDQILQIFLDDAYSPYSSRRLDLLATEYQPFNLTLENKTSFSLSNKAPPDFEFSRKWSVLNLDDATRANHNFELINVTMSGERCFGGPLQQLLLPLGGVSPVVANNVMYSIGTGGILKASHGQSYSWRHAPQARNSLAVSDWMFGKLGIVIISCLSFFVLSTTTALLVRVLISSGVVMLFPIFSCLQMCGLPMLNTRLISLSYPWLGIPMELLRQRQQSTLPFLISHISRVILYYFIYEACQLVATMWFYGQGSPGEKEIWLFAIVMILEYFSMLYLRAAASIQLFPRASFLLFLLYHAYLYSFPAGFHLLALLVLFMVLTWLMIFTVRKMEYPAYMAGEVSLEQPRMLFNRLPWPSWSVALAPDYTIFMPVNFRTRSVYEQEINEAGEQEQGLPPLLTLSAALPRPRPRPDRASPLASTDESEEEKSNSEVLSDRGSHRDSDEDGRSGALPGLRSAMMAVPGARWIYRSETDAGYSHIPDMEESKSAAPIRRTRDIEMG